MELSGVEVSNLGSVETYMSGDKELHASSRWCVSRFVHTAERPARAIRIAVR